MSTFSSAWQEIRMIRGSAYTKKIGHGITTKTEEDLTHITAYFAASEIPRQALLQKIYTIYTGTILNPEYVLLS